MEILYYYMIIAFSFAIMFTIGYAREVVRSVLDALVILEIDYKTFEYKKAAWSPFIYLSTAFIVSFGVMPLVLYAILLGDKWDVVLFLSRSVLADYFKLNK